MEGRMSICNMSIEGGARAGYVNPDETTYEWMKETDYFQENPEKFDELKPYWESIRSDADAEYDDVVHIDANELEPVVTWGTTPWQESASPTRFRNRSRCRKRSKTPPDAHRNTCASNPERRWRATISTLPSLGSCTNARLPDLRRAARIVEGRQVDDDVRAMVVPGSQRVQRTAEEEGLKTPSRKPASSGETPAVRCVSA